MKNIIIAGGSGFLGSHLSKAFVARGFSVIVVSRSGLPNTNGSIVPWEELPRVVDGAHAVINLAGTNVGGKRWSAQVRHTILQSRVDSTRLIVNAINMARERPAFISASAVGVYGNTMVPSNEAMGAGQTFLASVVSAWEREAMLASEITRVVCLRIGVVLDAMEGALPRLALPMRLGVGGPLGSGKQWFPWIHINDVVEAFVWATLDASATGPYNVVAPDAVTMGQMSAALGKVLHRPSWLPVPSAALRLLLGRQADVVVHGQHVVPMRLLGTRFRFTHPHLDEALRDLLRNS
ncbi:MAG: TIGR01777 family oxidoreductase [Candidatus Kapabacteria bacterium]|nr:TIGR01777 family oxidoreductase [Candidatus Kapabacteria bacterium]